MKNRLSILLFVVCSSAGTIACSTDEPPMPSDTPTQTTPTSTPDENIGNESSAGDSDVENPEGNDNNEDDVPTETNMMHVKIGNATFTAILENTPTTTALKALLPMTVVMEEHAGNEKFYYLPQSLPTDSYQPGTIYAGDIMLWGNDCLVLFYKTFSSPYSYTRIGHIDNPAGLAHSVGGENITIRFE